MALSLILPSSRLALALPPGRLWLTQRDRPALVARLQLFPVRRDQAELPQQSPALPDQRARHQLLRDQPGQRGRHLLFPALLARRARLRPSPDLRDRADRAAQLQRSRVQPARPGQAAQLRPFRGRRALRALEVIQYLLALSLRLLRASMAISSSTQQRAPSTARRRLGLGRRGFYLLVRLDRPGRLQLFRVQPGRLELLQPLPDRPDQRARRLLFPVRPDQLGQAAPRPLFPARPALQVPQAMQC